MKREHFYGEQKFECSSVLQNKLIINAITEYIKNNNFQINIKLLVAELKREREDARDVGQKGRENSFTTNRKNNENKIIIEKLQVKKQYTSTEMQTTLI